MASPISLLQVLNLSGSPTTVTQTTSTTGSVYATGCNVNVVTYGYNGHLPSSGPCSFQYFNPILSSNTNISTMLFSSQTGTGVPKITTSGSTYGYSWITVNSMTGALNGTYTINTIIY